MTDNELLILAEREAQRLTDENDHCAEIIMRALMERVRHQRDVLRSVPPSPFLTPGISTACSTCGINIGSGLHGFVCQRTGCPLSARGE